MLIKKDLLPRTQMEIAALDDLVPENHLVRQVEAAINLDFIYPIVEPTYSKETGRPSIDPVVLIKLIMLQHLFGIPSMRQTIKEVEVNVAYRWYLGYGFSEKIPHFSTYSKNYQRRFKDTNLFEEIFSTILNKAIEKGFIHPEQVFIDGTHMKAHANKRKYTKEEIDVTARHYQKQLDEEIQKDREAHNKKPLKPATTSKKKEK